MGYLRHGLPEKIPAGQPLRITHSGRIFLSHLSAKTAYVLTDRAIFSALFMAKGDLVLPRNLIIIGSGDFAELWAYYVKEHFKDYTLKAFSVDRAYIQQDTVEGLPVVAFETLAQTHPPQEYDLLVAIGYKRMNQIRKDKILQCLKMGYNLPNFVHPTAYLERDVRMGRGNLILERAVLAHGVTIGDGNILWNAVNLSHETTLQDFNYLAPGTILAGKSDVGSNCFFGVSSSIRGKRHISDYTVVGAGAYINEPTEPYGVYLPARTVRLADRSSTDLPFQK